MKVRNLALPAVALTLLASAAGYNLLSSGTDAVSNTLGTPGPISAASTHAMELSFSQDGRRLVAFQKGGHLMSWDLTTNKAKTLSTGVSVFSKCPSKDLMLKGKEDGTLAVETLEGKVITLLELGKISFAAWSEDCSRFAVAPKDKSVVELWHGTQIYPVASASTSMPVRSGIALSVDGTQIVVGVGSNASDLGHRTRIETFAPKADGQLARRSIYSAANGEPGNWRMVFSPVSSRLYVGSQVGGKSGLRSFETNSGSEDWHQADFVAPWVRALAVSPDGTQLVSGDEQGNLQLWDAATGQKLNSYKIGEAVTAVAFSRDLAQLAVGSTDGTIKILALKGQVGAGT